MADRFKKIATQLDDPSSGALVLTSHNTSNVANIPRAIYVGETGDIRVQMAGYYNEAANTYSGNSVITFSNVPAGLIIPIRIRKLYASTTANSIIGLY